MTEPQTEAGRVLYESHRAFLLGIPADAEGFRLGAWRRDILAIEAESRNATLTEVLRAVEGLGTIIAISRGRVDAMLNGRGGPVVWQRLAEDLTEAAAVLDAVKALQSPERT